MIECKPLVSVCCNCYNEAQFLRQCICGFLMQEPPTSCKGKRLSEWMEILIHDDASTDGCQDIIREFELKYPDIIKPIYEKENQYQNGNDGVIDFYNYRRAKGKYIAYCEADDFWTDPLKLQKQVDFMEANPEYTACFHEYIINDVVSGRKTLSKYPYEGDFDVTYKSFICEPYNSAHPMTMLFRVSAFSFEWQKHYKHYRDTMETFHILRNGKGRFLRFIGGIYNMHTGGASSQMPKYERARLTLPTYIDMLAYTHESFLKAVIVNTGLWALKVYDDEGHPEKKTEVYKLLFKQVPFLAVKVWLKAFKRKIISKC